MSEKVAVVNYSVSQKQPSDKLQPPLSSMGPGKANVRKTQRKHMEEEQHIDS